MTPANGARGIGLALEYMLNYAAVQPVGLTVQAARACIDAKNLVRGDVAPMGNAALLGRLEAIEAKVSARRVLLPRPTYVVQRSAGRLFSDCDYEALEPVLARRLVEVKTAEGRGVP